VLGDGALRKAWLCAVAEPADLRGWRGQPADLDRISVKTTGAGECAREAAAGGKRRGQELRIRASARGEVRGMPVVRKTRTPSPKRKGRQLGADGVAATWPP